MSIRNQRTRRHEDDIELEAYRHDGDVSVRSLLEHAEEIIGDTPEAYGATVSNTVLRLCELVRGNARTGERIDLDASVPLKGWPA